MKPTLIILLFLLIGCESKRAANKTEWLRERGYLNDSSSKEIIYKPGETKIVKDTTYKFSSDTLRTDSTIIVNNNFYREKHFHTRDSVIVNNNNINTIEKPCPECKQPFNWWLVAFFGLLIISVITLIKK